MKNVLVLAFFLLTNGTFGQDWKFERPSYKQIEKNISKKKSNLNYSELMQRFEAGDTTMTLEEKRHLYFGYTFHKKYSPYGRSDYSDSVRLIVRKDSLDSGDLDKIIEFGNLALKDYPFDLGTMSYMLYAFSEKQEITSLKLMINQANIIFDTILSSGDGATEKTAFYVIDTSHEYELLKVIGLRYAGSQSLIKHYDYLTVAENEASIEGLYFDVSPCLNSLTKSLKE